MRSAKFWPLCLAAFLTATALIALGNGPALAAGPKGKPAAAPKSIDDCERFKEALTYNACLASFGPVRHGGGAMVTPEIASNGDGKADSGKAASGGSRYSRRHGRSHGYHRSRQGRASASFSVPQSIITGNSLRRR